MQSRRLMFVFAMLLLCVAPASVSAQSVERQASQWAKRMNTAGASNDMNVVMPVLEEFTALQPATIERMLPLIWVELDMRMQGQLMRVTAFPMHLDAKDRPHASLRSVLMLGLQTSRPQIRYWAREYLNYFTFRNEVEVTDELVDWLRSTSSQPFREVCLEAVDQFVEDFSANTGDIESMGPRLRYATRHALEYVPAMRNRAISAGIEQPVTAWLENDVADEARMLALDAAADLQLSSEFFESHVLPLTARGNPMPVRIAAVESMTGRRHGWAIDHMLEALVGAMSHQEDFNAIFLTTLTEAIASYEAPKAIPTMIGIVAADETVVLNNIIGQHGLAPLTKTTWDPEVTDRAFWISWWAENRQRYGSEIESIDIPKIVITAKPQAREEDGEFVTRPVAPTADTPRRTGPPNRDG